MADIFTLGDYGALEPIVHAAQTCGKVSWFNDNGAQMNGIARNIGDEYGMAQPNVDIRELYLHVTAQSGWEHFIPIRKAMELVRKAEFAEYDW
jgi:hypothetical protein